MRVDPDREPTLRVPLGAIAQSHLNKILNSGPSAVNSHLSSILDALAQGAGEMSLAEIAREIKLSRDETFPLLKRLLRDGKIRSATVEGLQGADRTVVYELTKASNGSPVEEPRAQPVAPKATETPTVALESSNKPEPTPRSGFSLSSSHTTRVFDAITAQPKTAEELCRETRMVSGTMSIITRVLMDHGMVVRVKMLPPKGRFYYVYRLPQANEDVKAANQRSGFDSLRALEATAPVDDRPRQLVQSTVARDRVICAVTNEVQTIRAIQASSGLTRRTVKDVLDDLRRENRVVSQVLSWRESFGQRSEPVLGYRLWTEADSKAAHPVPPAPVVVPTEGRKVAADPKSLKLNPFISAKSPAVPKVLDLLTRTPRTMRELSVEFQEAYGLSESTLEAVLAYLRSEGLAGVQSIRRSSATGADRTLYGYYRTDKLLPADFPGAAVTIAPPALQSVAEATVQNNRNENTEENKNMSMGTSKRVANQVKALLKGRKGIRMEDIVKLSDLTFAQTKGALNVLEKSGAVHSAISASGGTRFSLYALKGVEIEVDDPMVEDVYKAIGQDSTSASIAPAIGMSETSIKPLLLQLFKAGRVTRRLVDPTKPVSPKNVYLYSKSDGKTAPSLSDQTVNAPRVQSIKVSVDDDRVKAILALRWDGPMTAGEVIAQVDSSESYVRNAIACLVEEGYLERRLANPSLLHSHSNPYVFHKLEVRGPSRRQEKDTVGGRVLKSTVSMEHDTVQRIMKFRWNKGAYDIGQIMDYTGASQTVCRDALAYLVDKGILTQGVRNPNRANAPNNPFVWSKAEPEAAVVAAAPAPPKAPSASPVAQTKTPTDHQDISSTALTHLLQNGAKSGAELARELGVSIEIVMSALDLLARQNLVEWESNPFPFASEENRVLFKAVRK